METNGFGDGGNEGIIHGGYLRSFIFLKLEGLKDKGCCHGP